MTLLFKALADETRIRVACALLESERCVHEVSARAGVSMATASHHLRVLRQNGLARSRRAGKFVYYRLDDGHVRQIVGQALAHVRERTGH